MQEMAHRLTLFTAQLKKWEASKCGTDFLLYAAIGWGYALIFGRFAAIENPLWLISTSSVDFTDSYHCNSMSMEKTELILNFNSKFSSWQTFIIPQKFSTLSLNGNYFYACIIICCNHHCSDCWMNENRLKVIPFHITKIGGIYNSLV